MKTAFKICIGFALATSLLTSCAGSYYVTARPSEPVYERPVAPYAGAIWVPGEWAWVGGRYEYVHGYWTRPRGHRNWVQGHWENGPRGYFWVRGSWR